MKNNLSNIKFFFIFVIEIIRRNNLILVCLNFSNYSPDVRNMTNITNQEERFYPQVYTNKLGKICTMLHMSDREYCGKQHDFIRKSCC